MNNKLIISLLLVGGSLIGCADMNNTTPQSEWRTQLRVDIPQQSCPGGLYLATSDMAADKNQPAPVIDGNYRIETDAFMHMIGATEATQIINKNKKPDDKKYICMDPKRDDLVGLAVHSIKQRTEVNLPSDDKQLKWNRISLYIQGPCDIDGQKWQNSDPEEPLFFNDGQASSLKTPWMGSQWPITKPYTVKKSTCNTDSVQFLGVYYGKSGINMQSASFSIEPSGKNMR